MIFEDEEAVQEHAADQEIERAFREVVASAAGKRVLFWMLEQCGVYRDPFSAQNDTTNYVLGQQSIGRRLIVQLEAIDPRLYPTLLLEVAEMVAMDRAAVDAILNPSQTENGDAEAV